jgi:hypothetical protein
MDVWYTFNSLTNTEVTITVDTVPDGVPSDYVVVVYDACGGNEDTCSVLPPDPIVMQVAPNTDYVVRIYSNTAFGATTDFTLCVSGDVSTGMAALGTQSWTVFPNPGDGTLNIAYGSVNDHMRIELFDVTGRLVHSERALMVTGTIHPLQVGGRLPSGNYTLRLTGKEGATPQRVVVK